jgi:hypothetical protein
MIKGVKRETRNDSLGSRRNMTPGTLLLLEAKSLSNASGVDTRAFVGAMF